MRKVANRKSAKIHPEAHEQLKSLSARSGRRMDFLIDEAVFNYLQEHKPKKIQRSNDEE